MIKCLSDVTLYVAKYRGNYIRFGNDEYMFMGSSPKKSIAHSADKDYIRVTEYLCSIGKDTLADDFIKYAQSNVLNNKEWLVNAINIAILKPNSPLRGRHFFAFGLSNYAKKIHYTEDFYQYCRDFKVSSVVTIEEVTNVVT